MTATLDPPVTAGRPDPPAPSWRRRVTRSGAPSTDPRWTRYALALLLAATATLYLWGLGASGYANSYYAAAVQAGTQSWKAFLFGSLDSSNFITVDKPPASLWAMELSGRVFGFSSWSMLVPQALEGVAAVALLAATVRRVAGARAGLLAGLVLAATPAAALIFRFNNPDALLTLLLVAAAYATVRAIERAGTRWLLLAGACVGFAFLAKMGQAFLVVPGFGLAYLIAAPTSVRRRLVQLLAALVAVVVAGGWWIALVQFWPASSRPYIGGSTNNSALELALGYNGLGRLFGAAGNGGGGGGGGGTAGSSFGGATGLTRVFSSEMGLEVSWLLPAAMIALVAGLWLRRHAPRTDLIRAGLIAWGGWLVVTAATFSYMQGTIHPYYTVALVPGIAAVLALGATGLWRARTSVAARVVGVVVLAVTVGWAWHLLGLVPSWHPWVRWAVLVIAVPAAAALLVTGGRGRSRFVAATAVVLLTVTGLGASAAASVSTAATAHTGSIPTAFADATGDTGGPGGTSGSGGTGRTGSAPSGSAPSGSAPSGRAPSGGMPSGTGSGSTGGTRTGDAGGGTGGATSVNSALTTLLRKSTTTWAAATVGAQSAASLELASGSAVMGIGGFTGSDSAPTSLAAFQALVQAGKIHYFIAGGTGGGGGGAGGGGAGGSGVGSQIATWVAAHYPATTVGGQTVYDLTADATSSGSGQS